MVGSAIESFDVGAATLSVWLQGASQPIIVPWFWVRDNSRDASSFDTLTGQRTVDTFALDLDAGPIRVEVVQSDLVVHFADAVEPAVLPASVFEELSIGRSSGELLKIWRDPSIVADDPLDFRSVIDTDAALLRWLESIERYGFGMVRGLPGEIEGTAELTDRVGCVRQTVFGGIWTLSSDESTHADSAYSEDALEPHTDGSYLDHAPGLQLFVCSERSGEGGESVLVDGFAAAEVLRSTRPDDFALLNEVPVPAQYIEPGVDLRASRPTIRVDDHGLIEQVTFNNYDRSASLEPAGSLREWYEAYRALHELLIDRTSWLIRRLEPGDALLFDNWRILHGRLAYTGSRVFHGCYFDHADFESRIRVLRAGSETAA